MATSKQITSVQIGVYAYNGAYRAFENYPASFDCWNAEFNSDPEFIEGGATTKALSGYERANRMSWRPTASLDLDNTFGAGATAIRALLNKLTGKYVQDFYSVTTNGTGTGITALVLTSGAPSTDDYFNGMIVSGLTGGDVVITDYVGATRTATLASARTWTNGNSLTVKVSPSLPIVIGLSADNTTGNIIYYNFTDGGYGISRELTIGRQRVRMNLRGVNDAQNIDDSFRIA